MVCIVLRCLRVAQRPKLGMPSPTCCCSIRARPCSTNAMTSIRDRGRYPKQYPSTSQHQLGGPGNNKHKHTHVAGDDRQHRGPEPYKTTIFDVTLSVFLSDRDVLAVSATARHVTTELEEKTETEAHDRGSMVSTITSR